MLLEQCFTIALITIKTEPEGSYEYQSSIGTSTCRTVKKEDEYLKQILSTIMKKNKHNYSVLSTSSTVNNHSLPQEKIQLFILFSFLK